nr:hypothetical protein EUGRSUZ_G02229 [Ipomoea trifida]
MEKEDTKSLTHHQDINNYCNHSRTSPQGEPRQDVSGNALAREGHALLGDERKPADRAIELELVKPAIEALLMEDVPAVQLPDVVAVAEAVQANDAIRAGGGLRTGSLQPVRKHSVQIQLLGEHNDSGQAGTNRVVERVVDAVRIEPRREADEAEEREDEGAEVGDGVCEERHHENRNRFGGNVGELVL